MRINGTKYKIVPLANLRGADLRGADLRGANLRRADLYGAKGIICAGNRSDGYLFLANWCEGALWIHVGCRSFTIADARAHWENARKGTPLGDETFAMLDFIERMATIRNLKGE